MFAIQPQILQVGGTARYHFCSFFYICSKSRWPFCKLCICLFRTTSLVCRFRIPMTFCKLGPMQPYGRRTLTGSSGQDTVWAGTFWRKTIENQPGTMKNNEKPTWNHEKPWKTMKNQPRTMKNQPGTIKNHENRHRTMKNHENQPKTMKNQPGTIKNHENRPRTMKTNLEPWKTTWNQEKPT